MYPCVYDNKHNGFFFFSFFFCLGLQLWHMEVPRLGDESELQVPAYATATAYLQPAPKPVATPDP